MFLPVVYYYLSQLLEYASNIILPSFKVSISGMQDYTTCYSIQLCSNTFLA